MRRFDAAPLLSLAAALALAACGIFGPGEGTAEFLADARARWADRDISDYEYRFTFQCGECLTSFTRTYSIRVVDDAVADVRDEETGDPPPDGYTPRTVEDLFEVVADAIDRQAFSLSVQYHPVLGYPTRIAVDYDRQVADDEFVMNASDLEPID